MVSAPQQKESKTFTLETHLFVYDTIMNHAPMKNVPILLNKITKRSGLKMGSVTHRTTVQMTAQELGVVAYLQAAELLITAITHTVGFDVTLYHAGR